MHVCVCVHSAITLGRVAWVCPGQLAPHLGHFAAAWCNALRSIRDDVEKEHAFLGLCALLRAKRLIRLVAPPPLCTPYGRVQGASRLLDAISSTLVLRCDVGSVACWRACWRCHGTVTQTGSSC